MKKQISISFDTKCIDATFYPNNISIEVTVKDNECYLLYLFNRNKYKQYIRNIVEGELRSIITHFTWKLVFNRDQIFIDKVYKKINNELKYFDLNLIHLKITKYV